ncbi:hypothetical protein DER44DRAFT_856307 [Fusarium oxysporum]|nr:hypothetical protein DER44DRAFT_856307 [Fusarium oxysporum]
MGDFMDYRQGGGPPPLFNANEDRNDYMESLPVFLKTGEFSDLIIVCGNDRYRVHRLILGGRSNFFKVACNGNFKESDGEINLPDDDPAAVRKMIGYLYNIDYNPTTKQMPDYKDDVEAELSDTEYDAETRSKSWNGEDGRSVNLLYLHSSAYMQRFMR